LPTLFCGFGPGTLLLPAFALFFPLEVAVAATAAVHRANNAFKLLLLARRAVREVTLRFGLPAVAGASGGAALLGWSSRLAPVGAWAAAGEEHQITLRA
jgi:hypothetical protein